MQTRTPEQVERLRAAVREEAEAADFERFVAALGGNHRCFERFLIARNDNLEKAAAMLLATLAFRRRSGVGTRATADAVRRDGVGDWWCGTFAGRTETGCPVTCACHAFVAPLACGLTAWSWPQLLAVPLH